MYPDNVSPSLIHRNNNHRKKEPETEIHSLPVREMEHDKKAGEST
jgi:hypothetical protein